MLYKYKVDLRPFIPARTHVIFEVPDDTFRTGNSNGRAALVEDHVDEIFRVYGNVKEPFIDACWKPVPGMLDVPKGALRVNVVTDSGKEYTLELPPRQGLTFRSLDDIVAQLELVDVRSIAMDEASVPLEAYNPKPGDARNKKAKKKPLRVAVRPDDGPNFIVEFDPDDISPDEIEEWVNDTLPELRASFWELK